MRVELEWVTELLMLKIKILNRGGVYILELEESSKHLSLTDKQVQQRQSDCGCSGIRNSLEKKSSSFIIKEYAAKNMFFELQKMLGSIRTINTYCHNSLASHHRFFGGNIKLDFNQGESVHAALSKIYDHSNQHVNCDVMYTGMLLTGYNGNLSLERWRSITKSFNAFFYSLEKGQDKIKDYVLISGMKEYKQLNIFKDFFNVY